MSKGPEVGSCLVCLRNVRKPVWLAQRAGSGERKGQGGSMEPDGRAWKPWPLNFLGPPAKHLPYPGLTMSPGPRQLLYRA